MDIKSKFHENKDWNRTSKWPGPSMLWHQEQVPRKQGLKPTIFSIPRKWSLVHQEQVPRKQGLKLPLLHQFYHSPEHQEQVPRKQGLKQIDRSALKRCYVSHQEQVPRKQGLKPNRKHHHRKWLAHQEQVPRKQGLKPPMPSFTAIALSWASRASSTKTRIETWSNPDHWYMQTNIKSKFHENKDWNLDDALTLYEICTHQEQVPRKQGLKLLENKPGLCQAIYHQEQVPRKQGLKHRSVTICDLKDGPSRASSTKTRIET